MFGDRCQGHLKRFRHIGHSHVIFQQQGEDPPPCRVREGGKDEIKRGGHDLTDNQSAAIVNRMVEFPF